MTRRLDFPVSVTLTSAQWAIVYADLLVMQRDYGEDAERENALDTIEQAQLEAFLGQAIKEVRGL